MKLTNKDIDQMLILLTVGPASSPAVEKARARLADMLGLVLEEKCDFESELRDIIADLKKDLS